MAGVSDMENKHEIRKWLLENRREFKRVLDIGAGVGTYALMGRFPEQHWTALEVFEPYVEMFNLTGKYNEVFVGDVRDHAFNDDYNLIIAADMLEHMKKDEAKAVVAECLKHCQQLLVCIPLVHHDQEAGPEGNVFETHVDHWHAEEMRILLSDRIISEISGNVVAYFLAQGDL
ncbi:MAG TPA: class I SAM-dependent methyltransferase [Candidatus Saccharibacteria bacterium]|nr:class I SAM-dependent methyltransferase [Candidatus Saccharibacteria bacterium]